MNLISSSLWLPLTYNCGRWLHNLGVIGMSSIASCTLVPFDKLGALRKAAVPTKGGLFRRPEDTFYDS